MTRCKVIHNLYCNTCVYPPFKTVHGLNYTYIRSPLIRKRYRVTDISLWFDTDFKFGAEEIIERVSKNGKYGFSKHLKIFDY